MFGYYYVDDVEYDQIFTTGYIVEIQTNCIANVITVFGVMCRERCDCEPLFNQRFSLLCYNFVVLLKVLVRKISSILSWAGIHN